MRNAAFAQWVLTLMTTPESAAAAIGDLIESGAGPWQLWATVASRVARSLTAATLALGVVAYAAQVVLGLIPAMGYGVVVAIFRPSPGVVQWGLRLFSLPLMQVAIGYWIGRYGRTRVLGICLVIATLDCAIGEVSIPAAFWTFSLLGTAMWTRSRRVAHA